MRSNFRSARDSRGFKIARNVNCVRTQRRSGKFEMSAESGRKRAYSTDIRLRFIYQRIGMGLRCCEIATNLNIAISTAFRIFKQFEISGDIGIPEVRIDSPDPNPLLT